MYCIMQAVEDTEDRVRAGSEGSEGPEGSQTVGDKTGKAEGGHGTIDINV